MLAMCLISSNGFAKRRSMRCLDGQRSWRPRACCASATHLWAPRCGSHAPEWPACNDVVGLPVFIFWAEAGLISCEPDCLLLLELIALLADCSVLWGQADNATAHGCGCEFRSYKVPMCMYLLRIIEHEFVKEDDKQVLL